MKQRHKPSGNEPIALEIIEEIVKKILVDSFKITAEQIATGTKIRRDLGLDEFQYIEFVGELEARFNVAIDSDEVSKLETVGQLTEYLKSLGALT